ncbi:MAG TPA: hypothetical protein VNO24_06955, partial [Blastocatellia bacterium]|nr:hypothetical protein [Blastocatellia bacterium]
MNTRSRITTLLVFAFASLAFAPQSLAQTEGTSAEDKVSQPGLAARGTDEQNLLELAYGKLILYVKAGQAFRAARKSQGASAADELRLALQNIRTGPVDEILEKPYGRFVTKPTGYLVKIVPSLRSFDAGPNHVQYEASWVLGDYKRTMLEDWDRATVRDVLRLMGAHTHDIDKYTSYEVT